MACFLPDNVQEGVRADVAKDEEHTRPAFSGALQGEPPEASCREMTREFSVIEMRARVTTRDNKNKTLDEHSLHHARIAWAISTQMRNSVMHALTACTMLSFFSSMD